MLTFLEAITALIMIKQKDGEDLLDYVKRFKQVRTTYKSYLGTSLFNDYVEALQAYTAAADDAARTAIKTKTFEEFLALLVLNGAAKGEYGELMKQLNMQKSMGQDQYQRTSTAAVDILANHIHPTIRRTTRRKEAS